MTAPFLIAAAAAFAAPQSAGPDAAPDSGSLPCSLVTPAGDAVAFQVVGLSNASGEIGLVSDQDSVWPERTLPAARGVVAPEPPGTRRFALGGGDGLVFELGSAEPGRSRRSAVLLRRNKRRTGVPLAHGFCAQPPELVTLIYAPIDTTIDPRQVGQGLPAFDPKRWPEHSCALILSDGRRTSFRFDIKPGNIVELASPLLWRGKALRLPMKWSGTPDLQVGTFAARGGPAGTQTMIVENGDAVKLITFADLGDKSLPGVTAYGICGYRGVTKKASFQ